MPKKKKSEVETAREFNKDRQGTSSRGVAIGSVTGAVEGREAPKRKKRKGK
jgi:hypothetical protein